MSNKNISDFIGGVLANAKVKKIPLKKSEDKFENNNNDSKFNIFINNNFKNNNNDNYDNDKNGYNDIEKIKSLINNNNMGNGNLNYYLINK